MMLTQNTSWKSFRDDLSSSSKLLVKEKVCLVVLLPKKYCSEMLIACTDSIHVATDMCYLVDEGEQGTPCRPHDLSSQSYLQAELSQYSKKSLNLQSFPCRQILARC